MRKDTRRLRCTRRRSRSRSRIDGSPTRCMSPSSCSGSCPIAGSSDDSPNSGLPANLRDPPAKTHEQKTPVVKELRPLPLEGVAEELQCPSDQKQGGRQQPRPGREPCDREPPNRNDDEWDAERVAETVDRMLMAGRVLRDPLFGRAAPHQAHFQAPTARRTATI